MQSAPDSLNKILFRQNELKVDVNKTKFRKKQLRTLSELISDLESFILRKPVTVQDKILQAALQEPDPTFCFSEQTLKRVRRASTEIPGA